MLALIRRSSLRNPAKPGTGQGPSWYGKATTLVVWLVVIVICMPTQGTAVIALVDATQEHLFGNMMRPLEIEMEVLPTLGNFIPQKLFLMLTTREPVDIVFDVGRQLRDYARNGLLRNLGSYAENREHFKHHKEHLLIIDGDVYGYVHVSDRIFINQGAMWGVAVARDSQLTDDATRDIMQLVLQAGPGTPANPHFEARRAATFILQHMHMDADYKTAYVYVHPSRTADSGPSRIDAEDLAYLAEEGYYSRLNVTRVSATEVTEIARWENPYDGLIYDNVFEVRIRLTHRAGNASVPHELFVHVQEVDGEWLVFVSRHGFE